MHDKRLNGIIIAGLSLTEAINVEKKVKKLMRILAALPVVLLALLWKLPALASDYYYPTDDESILIVVVFGGALIIILAVVISVVSSVVSSVASAVDDSED